MAQCSAASSYKRPHFGAFEEGPAPLLFAASSARVYSRLPRSVCALVMEVSPGRNGYECNPVIYCMAVERAPPGIRVATILRYKVEVRSRHVAPISLPSRDRANQLRVCTILINCA